MNKSIKFTSDQMIQMAQYVAELTRQNIAYEVKENADEWFITATGY